MYRVWTSIGNYFFELADGGRDLTAEAAAIPIGQQVLHWRVLDAWEIKHNEENRRNGKPTFVVGKLY